MRRFLPDVSIIALLFLLPLILFSQQTIGGRTLLPTENPFQYEPFASYREAAGAPDTPHNALVSDLILQNYQWKSFIRASFAQGEVPLWNPHQFAGIPFMAAGQQSTLYPFSILYYILPLTAAYGWFMATQLWLAGAFMVALARGLGISRGGALLAGVIYQLSGFFVISAVFPMIIAAAVWLPLILLMIEFVIRRQPALRGRPATIPWVALGAIALGCNILAGHVEITYYTLIIAAYYAAARLVRLGWHRIFHATPPLNPLPVNGEGTSEPLISRFTPLLRQVERGLGGEVNIMMRGAWLLIMIALGIGLGAVQFIPLFEVASTNFRVGSASFEQVLGWAHPFRDAIQFILPNFYGNPSHHAYVDVFTGETIPATVNALGQPINTIDWGIKNYVEGALYLGILPLALSVLALVDVWFLRRRRTDTANTANMADTADTADMAGHVPTEPIPPYRVIFAVLTLFSLTFMFGLPTYGVLFFTLPGIDQLHSPFRWIFAVTLSIAVLSGFGLDVVRPFLEAKARRWVGGLGWLMTGLGLLTLIGLLLSRIFYSRVEPLIDRIFNALAKAPEAFADSRMFYSYQFTNVLTFGLIALAAGVLILLRPRLRRKPIRLPIQISMPRQIMIWQGAVIVLVAVDLMIASWGFNPASDPALLDYTPPAIAWLLEQEGDWRYTTLDDPNQPPIMNANMGMRYGLDDIRGYESIISKQYVDYMADLAPQVQLDFNRVAPIFIDYPGIPDFDYREALDSPKIDALNVRYILSHLSTDIDLSGYEIVYEDDGVRIWENEGALPRAILIREGGAFESATITHDTGREKLIDVSAPDDGAIWSLVVSESYDPQWRAFIRPSDAGENAETPLEVSLHAGNLQRVEMPESGDWIVRLVYSPQSFQVGGFGSFISGVVILFLLGVWLWRLFVTVGDESSTASRVAKNSIAPILLNLFNRGIDFAFAIVMLRVLGPEDAGIYYYAIIIFGWFEIFTNFGLNVFLTREVSRDRDSARSVLLHTSVLRFALVVIGIPLLLAFLGARQSFIEPALTGEALLVIGLLYIGLIPNSFSTGFTALFYAFERAEVPAAITTIATISKTMFGLAALLVGFGAVGLAGVSILTNLITVAILAYVGRGMLTPKTGDSRRTRHVVSLQGDVVRGMMGESFPLMLNHFLASIFFQIDIILIEAMHGAVMVGQYSVAYKWVLALNIIPSFFTQALLPVMSRLAKENIDALKRNYTLAIKLLVTLALPTAVFFTFAAYMLTGLLGGSEFLPDGAIALQLMIWSIPIGWMNSLTQYVLIALDLQRRITRAFIIGVSFNIITNLIFIPTYGYQAAALTTIASEIVLFIPFAFLLRGALGNLNWWGMVWRSGAATLLMLLALLIGWARAPIIAMLVALVVYGVVVAALHPDLTARGLQLARSRLPGQKAAAVESSE